MSILLSCSELRVPMRHLTSHLYHKPPPRDWKRKTETWSIATPGVNINPHISVPWKFCVWIRQNTTTLTSGLTGTPISNFKDFFWYLKSNKETKKTMLWTKTLGFFRSIHSLIQTHRYAAHKCCSFYTSIFTQSWLLEMMTNGLEK